MSKVVTLCEINIEDCGISVVIKMSLRNRLVPSSYCVHPLLLRYKFCIFPALCILCLVWFSHMTVNIYKKKLFFLIMDIKFSVNWGLHLYNLYNLNKRQKPND